MILQIPVFTVINQPHQLHNSHKPDKQEVDTVDKLR